jgi:hypothetical protein
MRRGGTLIELGPPSEQPRGKDMPERGCDGLILNEINQRLQPFQQINAEECRDGRGNGLPTKESRSLDKNVPWSGLLAGWHIYAISPYVSLSSLSGGM